MKIGIVGLPYVGKTAIFNALTQSRAETGTYTEKKQSNVSVVTVPDERLQSLAEILEPKQITPVRIDYVDVAGISKGNVERSGLGTDVIADLRQVDALAHVVRVFEDDSVPHVDGSVDPKRDIETVDLELTFADLQIIDKRLERLNRELRAKKSPVLEKELAVLEGCKETLESGIPLREIDITPENAQAIRGYGFLTQKPLLLILNIAENQLDQVEQIHERFAKIDGEFQTEVILLSAKLEMEIAQLDAEDVRIFLGEMGLEESALKRVIQASYRLLGLITFFTVVSMELRAWTLPRGLTVVDAAATIHTDLARGFIRAETIHWKRIVDCGSPAKARELGLLRLEGREYVVQDGDVLTIRFNV
jgi:GTP-binding protein YchF